MRPPHSRSLPNHPDFEQQKKQAKELLQSYRAGNPAARARLRDALPDKQIITLADTQFVLAREYGFESWGALREHIEARRDDLRSPQERIHNAFLRSDAGAVRRVLETDRESLDLRTGHGDYGEKPPSSHHIYVWTIGENLSPIDVAAQFEQSDTLELMLAFATPL